MSEALSASRLKIPTSWAVAVIAALGMGGGGAAIGHYRLEELEKKVEAQAVKREDDQEQRVEVLLKLQSISDRLANIEAEMKKR